MASLGHGGPAAQLVAQAGGEGTGSMAPWDPWDAVDTLINGYRLYSKRMNKIDYENA